MGKHAVFLFNLSLFMKFIYNVTFVVEADSEAHLLQWLREKAAPSLFNPFSPAENAGLRKVVEVDLATPEEENGVNIALQAGFETIDNAHEWQNDFLKAVLEDFMLEFKGKGVFFFTLLECLNL